MLPLGIIDVEGTIQGVNREMQRLTGYDGAELVGRSLEMLVPSDRTSAHRRHCPAGQASGCGSVKRCGPGAR